MIDPGRPDAMQRMGVKICRDPATGEPLAGLFLLSSGKAEPAHPSLILSAGSAEAVRMPKGSKQMRTTNVVQTGGNQATDMNGRILLQVCLVRYNASRLAAMQGFADVEIDGVLRLNGVHLMRDGSIGAPRLTPLIHGKRVFTPAIEIPDVDLRQQLITTILAAIETHLETLSPGERMKPHELRKPDERPAAVTASGPARATQTPESPPSQPTQKPRLPPPPRLLVHFPRRML